MCESAVSTQQLEPVTEDRDRDRGQTFTFFFMASSCSFIAKHFFVLSIASLSNYSDRDNETVRGHHSMHSSVTATLWDSY